MIRIAPQECRYVSGAKSSPPGQIFNFASCCGTQDWKSRQNSAETFINFSDWIQYEYDDKVCGYVSEAN